MSKPIDRILNSKVKERKLIGRITGRSGSKFVITTSAGQMQVDGPDGYNIGDNVVVSGTIIVGRSGVRPQPKEILV